MLPLTRREGPPDMHGAESELSWLDTLKFSGVVFYTLPADLKSGKQQEEQDRVDFFFDSLYSSNL